MLLACSKAAPPAVIGRSAVVGEPSRLGAPAPSEARPPETSVIERTAADLRQYDKVSDPALLADLRKSLFDDARALETICAHDSERDSWEPVRAALVRWMNAHADDWTPGERNVVAHLMFDRATVPWFRDGFDAFRLAAPVIKAFAQSDGKGSKDADEQAVEEAVVCPHRSERSWLQRAGGCTSLLYGDALDRPGGLQSLVGLVSQTGSDSFTRAAVLNVVDRRGTPYALDLVDALASDQIASLAALRALGDFDRSQRRSPAAGSVPPDPVAVVARVRAWWRVRPNQRGALLYILTRVGSAGDGVVTWEHLGQVLGVPLNAAQFGAFLDQDLDAIEWIDDVSHALERGWSRTAVISPRFDRWLRDYAEQGRNDSGLASLLDNIARSYCNGGTWADLDAFQTLVRSRADEYPSQKDVLQSFGQSRTLVNCLGGTSRGRGCSRPSSSGTERSDTARPSPPLHPRLVLVIKSEY